jgi:hypothetical protein
MGAVSPAAEDAFSSARSLRLVKARILAIMLAADMQERR